MKNGQKKRYAQLVEAQTPEPQELPELCTRSGRQHAGAQESAGGGAGVGVSAQTDTTSVSDGGSTTSTEPQQHLPVVSRKASQCDSQMSTSFVSTSSSHRISIPQDQASMKDGIKLDRSVSRSMLDLDTSAALDEFTVKWTSLTYSYKPSLISSFRKKPNLVLRDLSGQFKSNQLIAIIGPSGCGKTTLLQFLAGNIPAPRDQLTIRGLESPKVAYIGQDDCLLPGLTARETLVYASLLQNSKSKRVDHHGHVQVILDQLGLTECADRCISKLSGGQVKRVTIGQELLYPTNLLILDEVTSGLDASTSYSIVGLLKKLVSDNRYPMSIVMSIHQPSAKLFSVFDKVYVMSEGQCIYEGSCQFEAVNAHLQRFGLECSKFHNIADYLIEIACADSDFDRSILDQMVQFQRKHSSGTFEREVSPRGTLTSQTLDNHFKVTDDESQNSLMLNNNNLSLYKSVEQARRQRERSIGDQFLVHLRRSLLRISRSSILTYLQFITYILLGLQLATFYGGEVGKLSGCPRLPMSFMALALSEESEDNLTFEMRRLQENMNFLLVAIMTATFAALEITVITFPLEAKAIKREWRNGWYRVSSYFLGRTLADLPFQLTFVIAFCVVVYSLTGQIGLFSWRFATFVLIIIMTALIAQAVGFIFGALFMDNLPAAVFTAPLCIFPALLFSGFFSRVSQIPSFYMPMTYLSHFRYAFDALLVSLYGFNRCNCDQETLVNYHASLQNQTGSVRDMFKSLFGANDCPASNCGNGENSIEDITTASSALLSSTTTTTMRPLHLRTLEDALVDSVFEHMNSTNTTTTSSTNQGDSVMDVMIDKFSTRVTSMLNKQANFGQDVPKQCSEFNSYLMAEFDLHDNDIVFALMMLTVFVIASRLISLAILSFTISSRSK